MRVYRRTAMLAASMAFFVVGMVVAGVARASDQQSWVTQRSNNGGHGLYGSLYTTNAGFGTELGDANLNYTVSHLYYSMNTVYQGYPMIEVGYYNGRGGHADTNTTIPRFYSGWGDPNGVTLETDWSDWPVLGTTYKYELKYGSYNPSTGNGHWYVYKGESSLGPYVIDYTIPGLSQGSPDAGGELDWNSSSKGKPKMFTVGRPPWQIYGKDAIWRTWNISFTTHWPDYDGCHGQPSIDMTENSYYQDFVITGWPVWY